MKDSRAHEFARLLAAAGWSQAEAARKLQITRGAVSQILSGKTTPRASTLNLLRLMTQNGGSGTEASSPELLQTWEAQLLRTLRGMPSDRRELTLGVIKRLALKKPAFESKRSRELSS